MNTKITLRLLGAMTALLFTSLNSYAQEADSEIKFGCDRFAVSFTSTGGIKKVTSTQKELYTGSTKAKTTSNFTLELQKTVYGVTDGKRWRIKLDSVSKSKDRLILSSKKEKGARLTFKVINKKSYLTLHLIKVETPKGSHATKFVFGGIPELRSFPLIAEVFRARGTAIEFTSLLKRGPDTPLGSMAIWYPENDEIDDEMLYNVWVNEELPHPNVEEEWTVERAKQWVVGYTEELKHFGEMYMNGENLDDLKKCVDYAAKLKIASAYMHLMTWSGRYHPVDKDIYSLNPKLFPNGRSDFKELSDYAKTKGVRLAMRTLSNAISLQNPTYVSKKTDSRLSSFWRGTLQKEINPKAKVLVIKSDKTLPTSYGMGVNKTKPAATNSTFKFLQVDDEIIKYDGYVDNKDGTVTIKSGKRSTRGFGFTEATSHQAGAPVKLLAGDFNDKVTGDHDSTLVDEIAGQYADFNNEMQLLTSNFDGLRIYTVLTAYGENKFVGGVYNKLDHYTSCTTSNGPPKWGWFEKDFNSVKKAHGLNKKDLPKKGHSIPQRMALMIGLHQDHWAAPSPYAYSYGIVPNAVASYNWLSVQAQTGIHDLDLNILDNFGLLDNYSTAIQQWREHGPLLPKSTKDRIFNSYGSGKYPEQVEHFRFEDTGDKLDVIPFRPMRRKVGDRGWGYIQEHGPVYTYQYIQPNTDGLVQVENPYHEQTPEFIIRVMKDFNRDSLTGFINENNIIKGDEERERLADELNKDANIAVHNEGLKEQTGKVNYRIMIPPQKKEKRGLRVNSGEMQLEMLPNGAKISYDNKSGKPKLFNLEDKKKHGMISYNAPTSLLNAKGIGVVITGDGSNALFLIRVIGGGVRDYVIPIDFKGKRYIEIPDPQVSWSESRWPITASWKRFRGHTIKSVATGLAIVPGKTKASVIVEDIRLLPELKTSLIDPVIQYAKGTVSIKGEIHSDTHIWYKGGKTAGIFDLNWNKLRDLPVTVEIGNVPKGRSNISVKNNNTAGNPWLECQFFVKDNPIHSIKK